jgi:hypothetical protein
MKKLILKRAYTRQNYFNALCRYNADTLFLREHRTSCAGAVIDAELRDWAIHHQEKTPPSKDM